MSYHTTRKNFDPHSSKINIYDYAKYDLYEVLNALAVEKIILIEQKAKLRYENLSTEAFLNLIPDVHNDRAVEIIELQADFTIILEAERAALIRFIEAKRIVITALHQIQLGRRSKKRQLQIKPEEKVW